MVRIAQYLVLFVRRVSRVDNNSRAKESWMCSNSVAIGPSRTFAIFPTVNQHSRKRTLLLMRNPIIDIWNPETFDLELREALSEHNEIICHYHAECRLNMQRYINATTGKIPYEPLRNNQYSSSFHHLQTSIFPQLIRERRIRVWHYTRLVDAEVEQMKTELHLSTNKLLACRLNFLVQHGELTTEEAEALFKENEFITRDGRNTPAFWSVTYPLRVNDSGVVPLLKQWGGEALYGPHGNTNLGRKLETIGAPRVIELVTPLLDPLNSYSIARLCLRAWAYIQGVGDGEPLCNDLMITNDLSDCEVINVLTEGDNDFANLASSYPIGIQRIETLLSASVSSN